MLIILQKIMWKLLLQIGPKELMKFLDLFNVIIFQ